MEKLEWGPGTYVRSAPTCGFTSTSTLAASRAFAILRGALRCLAGGGGLLRHGRHQHEDGRTTRSTTPMRSDEVMEIFHEPSWRSNNARHAKPLEAWRYDTWANARGCSAESRLGILTTMAGWRRRYATEARWPRSESEHALWRARSRIELKSVGIDIGSSTSHLIFSTLEMRRQGAACCPVGSS